jgi:hypothetical protein
VPLRSQTGRTQMTGTADRDTVAKRVHGRERAEAGNHGMLHQLYTPRHRPDTAPELLR